MKLDYYDKMNLDDDTPATTGVRAEFCDKCGWAIDEDNNNHKANCSNASTTGVHTATQDEFTEHTTARPWKYEESTKTIRSTRANYWLATMDSWDGAVDSDANARSIVRAVNNHDQLVAALKGVVIMLNTALEGYDSEPWAQRVRAALNEVEKESNK